jgi:hypothetical protein
MQFFIIPPSASSGLPVNLTIKGPATISKTLPPTVSITGAGTVTITATQNGSAEYLSATSSISFDVNKASQIITPFTTIPTQSSSAPPIAIPTPTSTSGLPVSISVSGPAIYSNGQLYLSGQTGIVKVTALQPGNSNFNAAKESTTFTVK